MELKKKRYKKKIADNDKRRKWQSCSDIQAASGHHAVLWVLRRDEQEITRHSSKTPPLAVAFFHLVIIIQITINLQ